MARNFSQRLGADGYTGTERREKWDLIPHKSKWYEMFILETNRHAVSKTLSMKATRENRRELQGSYNMTQLQYGCRSWERIGRGWDYGVG